MDGIISILDFFSNLTLTLTMTIHTCIQIRELICSRIVHELLHTLYEVCGIPERMYDILCSVQYTIDSDVVGVVQCTNENHLDNQRNLCLLLKESAKV